MLNKGGILQMGNLDKILVEELKGKKELGKHRRGEKDNIKKRITETDSENDCFYRFRTAFGCKPCKRDKEI